MLEKGATVKYEQGVNDLTNIFKAYLKMDFNTELRSAKIITNNPSCVSS